MIYRIFKTFLLFFVFLVIGCQYNQNEINRKPILTTISGRIVNPDKNKNQIDFVINRIGSPQETVSCIIDTAGIFEIKFECYIPTETYLSYQSNISVLTNPGDSIFLVFDGAKNDLPDILTTTLFSGDNKDVNTEYTEFLQLFYENRVPEEFRLEKIKVLPPVRYTKFEDSLKREYLTLFDNYSFKKPLKDLTKTWVLSFIENQYNYPVNYYPFLHAYLNNFSESEWSVPNSYYSFLNERLPLIENEIVSSDGLSTYINCYREYIYKITMQEQEKSKGEKWLEEMTENEKDSIVVYGMIENTSDMLLKQLIMSEFFSSRLKHSDPYVFDRFRTTILKNITEPFLIEPLIQEYKVAKETIEDPLFSPDLYTKVVDSSFLINLFDTILLQNKNQIILIDCWATWCSPCLNEFPHTDKLMTKLADKEIAFVFLCLQSKEDAWKAVLSKYKLTGQHYFLDAPQSNEFISSFNISGFPYYFLIGKSGEILEQGSQLRPSEESTLNKIKALL